ncbi:leucine-rich repeat and immunoglobulin-like domain-containing nogo receptor-interacting protein 1 isoform X1 [Vanessa cardui]|uniref:leucine-rich repeat and immunoglobulin-like domain-containing nogo receptor-interacting protein 1 isoform X1 n=1 Tax=Vanessa cardui TaxID=171605 RepID=UPI001F13E320|nr:leucine-rich repeat and immunoglobulin-like domain-containing nogo receptor-interacting protein 1 isoform X1 [Vanessa cardui]
MEKHTHPRFRFLLPLLMAIFQGTNAQCPWADMPELQATCVCAFNLARQMSVQCDQVDFPTLLSKLNSSARKISIDLLYINNSTIHSITDEMFINLAIHNLQISGCRVKKIENNAFKGQGQYLKNLNLQDNELTEVPVKALRILTNLSLLDISKNKITYIANHSFSTLQELTTLKISDNNVTLAPQAFAGLESSLKNLNLKGTKQKTVPECIRGLRSLAFLDLSQNSIRELPGPEGASTFEGLDSLTALNLERNLLVNLEKDAFYGIKNTLSSLSLLNNLLPEFPTEAIATLSDLRVLDIGFNLLNKLPSDAFLKNPSITLLALDGNPLRTVEEKALAHLNHSLRGLSLGGRFLSCDCRLRWIIEWIRNGELQVTSRERNPQFCGSPSHFRERGFYSFEPNELICEHDSLLNLTVNVETTVINESNVSQTTTPLPSSTSADLQSNYTSTTMFSPPVRNVSETTTSRTTIPTTTTIANKTNKTPALRPAAPTWRHAPNQRPPLVMNFPQQKPIIDDSNEVIVKNAYRQDNSVIIQWDSNVANILGFRVVYRLFGDKSFKQGPPLEASEREFKIKNVPSQECIVVCVISLEEVHVTPETVPYSQCREVRTVSAAATNMDKITIAASAAICGTIVVAVLVFAAASRRRSRTVHRLHTQLPEKIPNPCCGGFNGTPSPSGPLSSLATLGAFGKQREWDQVSAYSARSIPRARSYTEPAAPEPLPGRPGRARSLADGQSQHSYSHSGRYGAPAYPGSLLGSRTDLRQSRQSLGAASERASRLSLSGAAGGATSGTAGSRRRPRSRSRPASRYSVGSLGLGYCDTSDNWTDHDMDIYMARNPTRGGLVPL